MDNCRCSRVIAAQAHGKSMHRSPTYHVPLHTVYPYTHSLVRDAQSVNDSIILLPGRKEKIGAVHYLYYLQEDFHPVR